ncbi:hypothetical protein QQ045_002008 [Rhodiola kirilowii]
METPGAQDKAVAVAVKKSRNSQLALKWAVENLMKANESLTLVHVRPRNQNFRKGLQTDFVYGEMVAFSADVAKGLEQGYKENLTMQAKEMFNPLHSYCKKKNVCYDDVILEDEDVAHALSDFVLANNIDVLVIGAGSRGGIIRKLKGPDTATKISKNMPYFCDVYMVGKGGVVSIKSPKSTSKSPSSPHPAHVQEPAIDIPVQSFNSQMENRISVSAGEASLLQPTPDNEIEFRSPLKVCGDSNFTWVGPSPSDTDISFISPDGPFYDHESPRLLTNSSDRSLGSLDSRHTSPSTNSLGYSYSQGSLRCSGASFSPHKTLDESRRLQLELMHMKKFYAAAYHDHEAPDVNILASRMKSLNLEKDEGRETSSKLTSIA